MPPARLGLPVRARVAAAPATLSALEISANPSTGPLPRGASRIGKLTASIGSSCGVLQRSASRRSHVRRIACSSPKRLARWVMSVAKVRGPWDSD